MSWGVVNAGLYFLLQEKASLAEGARRAQLLEYQSLCRDNLETALTNLPLLMPARKESIELLLLGVGTPCEILPKLHQHHSRATFPCCCDGN